MQRKYRAFVSYSWVDRELAEKLHRRLERFVVPRRFRREKQADGRMARRLRPIFRDSDEMQMSGVLAGRLTDAIDQSDSLVLIASPHSAKSRFVDLEVEHFLATRGLDSLAVLACGAVEDGLPLFPASLGARTSEPLCIDARGKRGITRRQFINMVAIILGVGFDELWRRHVRRTRAVLGAWIALALVFSIVLGGTLWQRQVAKNEARAAEAARIDAERRSPERQRSDFFEWYQGRVREIPVAGELVLDFVRVDDINDDGLVDFFVINKTAEYCGSGGCTLEVFLTKSVGDYGLVLQLLGSSTPRVRPVGVGGVEIAATDLYVGREPLYSIYVFTGGRYELHHYEFCDGIVFEMCSPGVKIIRPLLPRGAKKVDQGATHHDRPDASSREAVIGAGAGMTVQDSPGNFSEVLGEVDGSEWYLARMWKSYCGFVSVSDVS